MDLACTTLPTLEATPDPQVGTSAVLKKTMRTQSWDQVRNQLYVLRNYLRQVDSQGGDISLDPRATYPALHRHHRHAAKAAAEKASHHRTKRAQARDAKATRHTEKTSIPEPVPEAAQEELDFFDGDLALPPPALDLPEGSTEPAAVSQTAEPASAAVSTNGSSPEKEQPQPTYYSFNQSLPTDQDEETRTGRHLSDMPLSPNYATAFGMNFGRAPPSFSPARSSGKKDGEQTLKDPPSAGAGGSQFNLSKTPSDGNQSKAAASATTADHSDEGAWWLHVHCPTYKDMHEISKLFPMHPLTVEDVLQQDPREKVDVFDRLGYYFVVIRAIDERYFRYTSTTTKSSPGSPNYTRSSTSNVTVQGEAESKTKRSEDTNSKEESIEMHEITGTEKVSGARDADTKERNDGHNARLAAPARLGKGRVEIVEGIGGKEGLEGVSVGANNLYLLVFSHGVISFAFEDVSKHIDRVAARLLEITRPVELTADWVAHDLYDSVVDAFFPLISFVQSEVVEVEELASEHPTLNSRRNRRKLNNFAPKQRRQRALLGSNPEGRLISVEPVSVASFPESSEVEKRTPMLEVRRLKTVRALYLLPVLHLPDRLLDRLPRFFVKQKQKVTISRLPEWEFKDSLEAEMRRTAAEIDEASNSIFDTQAAADQSIMLHRIADTRKIVTGLSRLLGPKNDAVKGLRKRLADMQQLQRRQEALLRIGGNARNMLARTEVSMYMSDVHDHIISMLNQLNSGEGRLSEIHHTYLAQITIENQKFRHGADSAILLLATIGLSVFIAVFMTSIFSVNVNRPGNRLESKEYAWFIGIALTAVVVPMVVYAYVKYLWKMSKRGVAKRRAAR